MRIGYAVIAPALLAVLSACGQIGITNRVLMVDQDGNLNLPEVLATQAQLSSNQTAVAIAEAKAVAADRAAREGTNMVNGIIAQIAANELTIYRQGFIDSITSDVSLPPDTQCTILKLTPGTGSAGGKVRHRIKYAATCPVDGIRPNLFYSDTISGGRGDMMPLPAEDVQSPRKIPETYEAPNGTSFGHVYEIEFDVPASPSGFFFVHLDGDASASGALFNIIGGIDGGATTNVPCGSKTLVFRGGLLIEVRD